MFPAVFQSENGKIRVLSAEAPLRRPFEERRPAFRSLPRLFVDDRDVRHDLEQFPHEEPRAGFAVFDDGVRVSDVFVGGEKLGWGKN